ncbi:MAG: hypothetical protein ACK4IS_11190 [Erythrobacter sp.]
MNLADRTACLLAAHPDTDQQTIDHLLDDHIAPRLIAATGRLVLHGSATRVGSHLVVFLGTTGSGKSTLAASLHVAGYPLLGDDAVAISRHDGRWYGEAVYPSLRLYDQSIEQVFAKPLPTSPMAFYSEKRRVVMPELCAMESGRLPLAAIYVLTEGDGRIALDRLSPAEGCITLIENSFALDPRDASVAAQRMDEAARLAASIPCYDLSYPYDFDLLHEVRARVLASLPHLADPA